MARVMYESSSLRLTTFSAMFDNHDLIVTWDFDRSTSINHTQRVQFQIIVEQESQLMSNQIIRRTGLISVESKFYRISHIPSNKNYFVCLLVTQLSYGTDKYCRETRTIPMATTSLSTLILSKQALVHLLFTNRSIMLGFLVGIVLTVALLLTLAFVCHLRSKRQRFQHGTSSIFHYQHPLQQQYLYADRQIDDAIYSNSFLSSISSAKSSHSRKPYHRHHPFFPPMPSNSSWYHRDLAHMSNVTPSTRCCFHTHPHLHAHPQQQQRGQHQLQQHTPDTTMSSSATTRRITTLSSQYSNGVEREPMTSTSIMSCTSSDEQSHANTNSPAKHVYEELTDETTMLRRQQTTDFFL
jgi:hypothetical protein